MTQDLTHYKPPAMPKGLVLSGDFISLVPLDADLHAAALFAAHHAPGGEANWTYLPYGPFDNVSAYHAWLTTQAALQDPCFFTLIRQSDRKAVGVASYLRIKPQDGSIEVGHIHFSPLLQQTAAATEAMYLMMKWAFEAGYRRYEWKCNAQNEKSRRAAQRLGLSYEGVFRQATIAKGKNRDTAWFAAIDSEWPTLQKQFETYLANCRQAKTEKPDISLTKLTRPHLYKRDDNAFLKG